MPNFTLKQCSYFLAVAEHGGIAQAARAMNITQPTVAQGLAKLEDLTGLELFQRHHARGADLTIQGRFFLRHVQSLMDHADQVAREAAALAARKAGELRLGCFMTIASTCLPGLIQSHKQEHPGIHVESRESSLADLVRGVRQGRLDLALTYDTGDDMSDLVRHPMAAVTPVILLPEGHPLAGQESVSLSELGQDPFVMFDALGSQDYFGSILAIGGIDPVIGHRSASLEGVRSAVANGLGFSIAVLRPAYLESYDGRKLVEVAIADDVPALNLILATRTEAGENPIADEFISLAQQYFRDTKLPGFTVSR